MAHLSPDEEFTAFCDIELINASCRCGVYLRLLCFVIVLLRCCKFDFYRVLSSMASIH